KNKSIQQKADKDLTAQTKDSLIEILTLLKKQNEFNSQIYNFLQQQSENNKNILAGIENLKDTIVNQNNILTNVLSNQIVALNSSFKSHFEHPKYTTLFPLSSEKDLNDFENMINDDNKSEIVSSIKRVLGNKNSQKEICNIISNKMLLEYNMRGIQGKKRLMDYKAIMNVIFLARSSDVTTELEFLAEMRKAIKCAKNKHFKMNCLKRKRDSLNESECSD
ncbi:hypothetical protein CVS40_10439, partial [Lucilia cuprina]